ncbi:D-ribulose-5-phosphate-3-epimerase [Striga asiatica]|uniref:D-ribulose-5-phosphate-3-epimerase n=1 Tax=Striga asiatica TaxID=4170 RepID=A0A5A7RDQ5_STRAF|nr:D-ribulose-5-phosphate-3-epimerase [Striga asiatica]
MLAYISVEVLVFKLSCSNVKLISEVISPLAMHTLDDTYQSYLPYISLIAVNYGYRGWGMLRNQALVIEAGAYALVAGSAVLEPPITPKLLKASNPAKGLWLFQLRFPLEILFGHIYWGSVIYNPSNSKFYNNTHISKERKNNTDLVTDVVLTRFGLVPLVVVSFPAIGNTIVLIFLYVEVVQSFLEILSLQYL